jgi:hypothetical protein
LWALSLAGCVGLIDAPPGAVQPLPGDPTLAPTVPAGRAAQFSCGPNRAPPDVPLRRLSQEQYLTTVRTLVQTTLPNDADAVLGSVASLLGQVPTDARLGGPGQRHGGFTVLDQTLQQGHADATYNLAVALGHALTSTTARMTALMGACATDASTSNDASCLLDFVRTFGARALRRPLTADDETFYLAGTDASPVDPATVADVVGLLLSAPESLFFVEHGTDDSQLVAPLSAFELASRLSYHFWRAPPDDALWASASSGALLSDAELKAQVDRLSADPRAAQTFEQFFLQWLNLDDLPELDALSSQPLFQAVVGADMPGPTTREAALDDVTKLVDYELGGKGSVSALLNERRSFATDPLLARLYGAPVWSGSGEPTDPSSPARVGLLTRIAFVASGIDETRPIMKGLRIRNEMMCQAISPPPANAAAKPPDVSSMSTTREVVEALTQSTSNCSVCHAMLINPLGFATENFDPIGRERTVQQLFDATGAPTGEKPISTTSVPRLASPSDGRESSGAGDLTRMLDESGQFHSCLSRQYYRFTFARIEDPSTDGCPLSELESGAFADAPLDQLFKSIAFTPEFRERSFP